MNLFISILESLYIIYMFNYYITSVYLYHPIESKVISSATILLSMPGTEIAIDYAKKNPQFSFGLHLNLITDDIQYATSAGTEVKNTSGTTVLALKVPTQSTAETGTENTQVMTPLRTKQSIQSNAITSVI